LRQGYSESVIKKICWGHMDTTMLATYGHLTDTDIDDEIASMAGVKPPAAKEAAECLEPRQCPRCYTVNGPTQNFCGECGLELTMTGRGGREDRRAAGRTHPGVSKHSMIRS
jgi:integrase/recombinase XerD